jgi:NADPH:quinone reductase-like Zn-dependent oxidoreductase
MQLCKKVYEDTITAVCHQNNLQYCKENGADRVVAYDDHEQLTQWLKRRHFDIVIDATPNGVIEETTRELVVQGIKFNATFVHTFLSLSLSLSLSLYPSFHSHNFSLWMLN